jgi:ketosteroid isomerase-like protein
LFHLQGGKVTRIISYWDRDRALADLGLEESAMSEEPTTPDLEEVLRRGVEALNRRDFDAAIAAFSGDGVWDMSALGVGVFTGHEAIRGLFEDWIGAYEDFEIEIEENLDLGNGVVLEVFVQKGRPLGSIGHLELRYANVFVFVGGIIERSQGYTDIDEARAAAERLAKERG